MASPAHASPTLRTADALEGLRQGHGAFVFLAHDDRGARSRAAQAICAQARGEGLETIVLRAHPLDTYAPYGTLLPWLSRWYVPPPVEEPTPATPTRPTLATSSFSIALAGLMLQDLGGSAPEGTAADPSPSTATPTALAAPSPAVPREPPKGAPLSRPLTPEEVRVELVDLVAGRARHGGAVVAVEDADLLDAPSREWLAFLGHRLKDLPLLVLLQVDPRLDEFLTWEDTFEHAPVAWEKTPGDPAPPPASRLGERLRALPARSVELLAATVLAGPDTDTALLQDVLGWTVEEIRLAASPAVDAVLLVPTERGYEALEPSLYPDLAGTLAKSKVSALHRSIARSISARTRRPQGGVLFRLSEHWTEGGEVASGVATLSLASLEAERWGAPEIAEGRLRRALALAQTEPTSKGREYEERTFAQLAATRTRAGDPAGARDAFTRALELSQQHGGKALHWARYVSGAADAETRLGGDPEQRLRSAYEQVKGRASEVEAGLLRSLAYFYVERGRVAEGVDAAEKACALAEKGKDAVLKVRTHQTAMSAYIFGGGEAEKARDHAERALGYRHEIEGTPDAGLLVVLMDGISNVECALGSEEEAVRRGEEALGAARRFGHRTALMLVLGNLAEHCLDAGRIDRAEELTEELRRMADRLGLSEKDSSREQLVLLEGLIAAARGNVAEARRRLEHLADSSERAGGRYFLGQALVHLIVLNVEHGDLEAARRHHRRLEKEGVRKTLVGQNRRVLELAEAKLSQGSPRPPTLHAVS